MDPKSPSGVFQSGGSGVFGKAASGIFEGHPDKLEKRKRFEAARAVAVTLARACEHARSYGVNHPTVKGESAEIEAKLKALVESSGELELTVVTDGLVLDEVQLFSGSMARKGVIVAKPLFDEGVRVITIRQGVPDAEVKLLVSSWIAGSQPSASGVATRFWEAELTCIQLLVIDTFEASEDATGDGSGVAQGGALQADGTQEKPVATAASLRAQIQSLVTMISGDGVLGLGDNVAGGAIISADDAALLRADGLRDITIESLARQEVDGLKIDPVVDDEVEALRRDLEQERVDVELRFARALSNAAVLAQPADRLNLIGLFQRFAEAKAREGHFQAVLTIYQKLVEQAKAGDGLLGPVRVEVLKQFKATLTNPQLVELLVAGLADDTTAPASIAALQTLGASVAAKLNELMPTLPSGPAKQRLFEFLRAKDSRGTAASELRSLDAAGVELWLERFPSLKPDEKFELLTRALSMTEPKLRRAAMEKLDRTIAARLPKQLVSQRVHDNDPTIRALMIRLVTETEDPGAVEALTKSLRRAALPADERSLVYTALGTIGGPVAEAALLAELERQSDTDLRVDCVRALSLVRTQPVRAALEKLATKVLIAPKLKAAAKEALAAPQRRAK